MNSVPFQSNFRNHKMPCLKYPMGNYGTLEGIDVQDILAD